MIIRNLYRRKTRTLLTSLGISLGIVAIIVLSSMANMFQKGYDAMMTGSKADLVLSQPDAFNPNMSVVAEEVELELMALPEVAATSSMVQGSIQTENVPMFFVFGYPQDSFILQRFQIVAGSGLSNPTVRTGRGRKVLLGDEAAEALDKDIDEVIQLGDRNYHIVGIYHTGNAFEDRGAVLELTEAQILHDRPRQVSLIYIQLKDPALRQRFEERVARRWPDLALSTTDTFADKQSIISVLQAYVTGISGLAILIGGVGVMNAQLMSVMERTREIGVLRSVGWSAARVMKMILGESILVSILGGLLGVFFAWLVIFGLSFTSNLLSNMISEIPLQSLVQVFLVVMILGILAGAYPAWRAAQLNPIEALMYEGGTQSQSIRRFPIGGMAIQSLWQRSARTLLTLSAIAMTVGAIMALQGVVRGAGSALTRIATGSKVEIMVRQAGVTSTSMSWVDERIGDRISVLPGVSNVSGIIFTIVALPETEQLFLLQGYAPNSYAIQRIRVVEGQTISSNRQIILGRLIAEAMNKTPGETIDLGGRRFRIVGIFETGVSWEEMGGIITLRDAQISVGQPRKVSMFAVKVADPKQAAAVVSRINAYTSEVIADLTGEFVEQLPDMEYTGLLLRGISLLAIFVGGMVVMNTMLMSVMERTREIGVLKALGWGRMRILSLILQEAIWLSVLGAALGIGIALLLTQQLRWVPMVGTAMVPIWGWDIFVQAIGVALCLGILGGLYPAYRATTLQPIEALRYE